jgi:hypothetical protein
MKQKIITVHYSNYNFQKLIKFHPVTTDEKPATGFSNLYNNQMYYYYDNNKRPCKEVKK